MIMPLIKLLSHDFDHFLCFFLGAESDSGICFYPSRLDFAVPEVAIFQYIEEWPYSVQQNLDVMGKNRCQNRIQRPKKHRK